MEAFKTFFDPAAYSQMEPGTKRAALKKAWRSMFQSQSKEEEDGKTQNGSAAGRRQSNAYNQPVLVDSTGTLSVYEVEAGENGVSEIGDHTPLKYSLSVPSGFRHLTDGKGKQATGTFVYGESNPTFLVRRLELASVEQQIAKLRQCSGPIDTEMGKLEARRAKLISQIEGMQNLKDRFEFCLGISQPTSVELLPLQDEDLQELSRVAEAEAQEKLVPGQPYDVKETKQHNRASIHGGSKPAERGEEVDQAEWQGWETLCSSPGRLTGVVLLRRKYIPDEGLNFQDITLSVTWIAGGGGEGRGADQSETQILPLLRQVADSITPIPSRRNPMSFDTIEVLRHLEMLKMDEGYMAFFQRKLPAGKNRPGELSQDADEIATLLSSVVVSVGRGGSAEFEDSFDSPVQEVSEAWRKLQAIALQDANNPLLMDQVVGGFYGGEEEGGEEESEEQRLALTEALRTAWAERVGRYVAFCIDGVTMGPGLRLHHLVEVAVERGGAGLAEDQRVIRRVLEFCVHYKAPGQGFVPGKDPLCFNLVDDMLTLQKQEAIASGDSRFNDIVLAKLIKLKYLRRLMGSTMQAYAHLLIALLARPANAVNLTLQVAKELADLACAGDTVHLLSHPAIVQAIAEHLHNPVLNEMVLYYAAIALNKLAQTASTTRRQLSSSTLTIVLRAHMARVSLRVRAASQQLLEQTMAGS